MLLVAIYSHVEHNGLLHRQTVGGARRVGLGGEGMSDKYIIAEVGTVGDTARTKLYKTFRRERDFNHAYYVPRLDGELPVPLNKARARLAKLYEIDESCEKDGPELRVEKLLGETRERIVTEQKLRAELERYRTALTLIANWLYSSDEMSRVAEDVLDGKSAAHLLKKVMEEENDQ